MEYKFLENTLSQIKNNLEFLDLLCHLSYIYHRFKHSSEMPVLCHLAGRSQSEYGLHHRVAEDPQY